MKVVNVSKSAKQPMPVEVKSFCDLLWVNLPKDWAFNCVYYQDTLFISIIIDNGENSEILKIQREYKEIDISSRYEDIWGLATDCAEEICHTARKSR